MTGRVAALGAHFSGREGVTALCCMLPGPDSAWRSLAASLSGRADLELVIPGILLSSTFLFRLTHDATDRSFKTRLLFDIDACPEKGSTSSAVMELYATGFNAWNQLRFDNSHDAGDEEPEDISSFTCILRHEAIHQIHAFLSYTRATLNDGATRVAGMVPRSHERNRLLNSKAYIRFLEAANGVVVLRHTEDGQTLFQYPSMRNLQSNDRPSHTFSINPSIAQLVAYETGFAALTSTGQVWTWGDERYTGCLGREPTNDSPAEGPGLVTDLEDLPTGPVTKLAAGGYILAALTAGNDLYCWGHAGRSPILDDISDTPSPVVIDDKDIMDVAVGESHMLVLTSDSEVYVIGDNNNGQLGLPGVASTKTWTGIDLGSVLSSGQTVRGVAAGPRNSFLIVGKPPGAR